MADNRIHQSIAERLDILFNQRLNPWRRWRRVACWLAGIVPLGWLGWSTLPGKQTVYQSGCVSKVHQGVGDDCGACHVQPFQPLRMLTGNAPAKRRLESQACGTCHPAEGTLDHNPLLKRESVADRAVDCFDCHQEHQDADRLLTVADAHCVTCHEDLNSLVSQPGVLTFSREIGSFGIHPEFAVVDPARKLEGTIHQAARLIHPRSRQDQSPFHFDHAAHLTPDGMLVPHAHPDYTEKFPRKRLGCSDCHLSDANGAYMQPISYQRHCAACHPLVFSTKLAQPRNAPAGLVAPWTLPHGSEEALHGVIRDRLIAFAREQRQPRKAVAENTGRPQTPNKARAAAAPSQNEYELAERELNGIQWGREIVQQSMGATGRVVRQGCEFCHEIEANRDFDPIQDFPWKVTRNAAGGILPDRWMPHSRFRHDRHHSFGKDALRHLLQTEGITLAIQWESATDQEVENAHCIVCHQGAISSNSAQSVLMPSIRVCQNCHGSTAREIGFARADCVECHVYHHDDAAENP